ncbi:putative rab-interacting lysosomal protein [Scophthalmus maximus]|uniref:Putative rab-interacting lysosomal protein n=1 Tax=Scophthalmus maximus TaxID=52904 RepID=A0A2U9B525_SCOMX|nr:RILP-like protein 1 isoform X2 [Scophthalmus maximus]AWO99073.1 putative rab-interacting lysosomal protein [Scophthalmus maximus]
MQEPRAAPRAARSAERCFDSATLTLDDVYDLAELIGAEVEKLIDGYGKESVLGLVPRLVTALELLESFASRRRDHTLKEAELLETFEAIRLQQQRKRAAAAAREGEEAGDGREVRELQQREQQWSSRCEELQLQVQQLQENREELQSRLKGSHAQEDRVQRQEREVMLKLKQVVDKQRDELRAKVQEITTISKEVEALQEQLDRFMKMNAELRHKQNVLQAQLKGTVERKADMEADLKEKSKEIENLQALLDRTNSNSPSGPSQTAREPTKKSTGDQKDPDQPCFTKKEVRDIIFERNELKTNLFLVQEELSYYQREILNEERCPGFLLEAVGSAIKKRKKLIKAKMLGISAYECSSSDEEERSSLFGQTEVDGAQEDNTDKPTESRIRNLFGFLTRSGSGRSPTHMSNSASSWEILGDSEATDGTEKRPSS